MKNRKLLIGVFFIAAIAILLLIFNRTYSYNELMKDFIGDNEVVEIFITLNDRGEYGTDIRKELTITNVEVINNILKISPDMKVKRTREYGLKNAVLLTLKLDNKEFKYIEMDVDNLRFQHKNTSDSVMYKVKDNVLLWQVINELNESN